MTSIDILKFRLIFEFNLRENLIITKLINNGQINLNQMYVLKFEACITKTNINMSGNDNPFWDFSNGGKKNSGRLIYQR